MNAAWHGKTDTRRGGGFTLVELVVTITVIVLLMTAMLTRVLWYQRQAEQLAVDQVVRALRSALQLQVASMMARGRMREVGGLADQNPMDWLAQRPVNYLGAYYETSLDDLDRGNWYFDKKERKLVYLFSHSDTSESAEPNQLSFKVKLVNNRVHAGKQSTASDPGSDFFDSAELIQLHE